MGEEWTLEQVRSCNADGYLIRNYDHLKFSPTTGAWRLLAEHRQPDFRGLFQKSIRPGTRDGQLRPEFFAARSVAARRATGMVRGDDTPAHADVSHGALCVLRVSFQRQDFRDCGRPCDRHDVRLRDRVGAEHPLKADAGCRNTVFNSQAQTGAEYVLRMIGLGVRHFRVEFLNETPEQVIQTISNTTSFCAAKFPARNSGAN